METQPQIPDRKIPLAKGDLIYSVAVGKIGYVKDVEVPSSPIVVRYDVVEDAVENTCEVFTMTIDAVEQGEHLESDAAIKIWDVFENDPLTDRTALYLYLPEVIQSQLLDWGSLITAIDEEIFLIQQPEYAPGGVIVPPTP